MTPYSLFINGWTFGFPSYTKILTKEHSEFSCKDLGQTIQVILRFSLRSTWRYLVLLVGCSFSHSMFSPCLFDFLLKLFWIPHCLFNSVCEIFHDSYDLRSLPLWLRPYFTVPPTRLFDSILHVLLLFIYFSYFPCTIKYSG